MKAARRAWIFGLVLAGMAAAWAGGLGGEEPATRDPARPVDMGLAAGAEECARCHGDVHATWACSTHALTVRSPEEAGLFAHVGAGLEARHPPGATYFSATADGQVWARTPGTDGEPTLFPVTHVVGKTRIEMLLTQLADGRRQVLPSMREHGTGTWFDYTALYFAGPGHDPRKPPEVAPGDPSFWTGPVRSWDAQCSRCHVSGREVVPPSPSGAPRTRERAWGLDCEACHGPAAAHVVHHDEMREGPDPIVKQRLLSRRRRVDACIVCHMESEELVPGWHPGEERDLLEFLDPTLLDDPDRVDPAGRALELVYAGVSFWTSRCAEEGGLTCQSCHDPHGGPQRSAMRTAPRDDAQCAGCHQEIVADVAAHTHHAVGSEGSRCVSCHMPHLTVERGHGSVTDHTISVPRPGLVSDRVAQDACTGCHLGARGFPPGAPPLSEPTIRQMHARWWPDAKPPPTWLATLADARRGAFDAPSRLQALLADRTAPRLARATAPVLLARHGPAARDLLLAHVDDPDSLVRRRVADGLVHVDSPAAWAALVRLLDDPSAPVRAHASRAALLAPGRLATDAAALVRVVRELRAQAGWAPDDDTRWERLADALALAGDLPGEIEALRRWQALDPDRAGVGTRLAEREARARR
jgi:predicted CXXCH cytochrome family protein